MGIVDCGDEWIPQPKDRWDIPKQKFLKENGEVGDCWRCCIAAILNMPADQVPHFLLEHGHMMDPVTNVWLWERGYIMLHGTFHTWRMVNDDIEIPPMIYAGPTERSKGMGQHHAVVFHKGQMVYDPHPSEAGLTAVTDKYLIVKKDL